LHWQPAGHGRQGPPSPCMQEYDALIAESRRRHPIRSPPDSVHASPAPARPPRSHATTTLVSPTAGASSAVCSACIMHMRTSQCRSTGHSGRSSPAVGPPSCAAVPRGSTPAQRRRGVGRAEPAAPAPGGPAPRGLPRPWGPGPPPHAVALVSFRPALATEYSYRPRKRQLWFRFPIQNPPHVHTKPFPINFISGLV